MAWVYILQETRPVDQDVAFDFFFLAVLPNLYTPCTRRLIPDSLENLRSKLDMFRETIFIRRPLDIGPDLLSRRKKRRPVRVGFKRKGIDMGRDIALSS